MTYNVIDKYWEQPHGILSTLEKLHTAAQNQIAIRRILAHDATKINSSISLFLERIIKINYNHQIREQTSTKDNKNVIQTNCSKNGFHTSEHHRQLSHQVNCQNFQHRNKLYQHHRVYHWARSTLHRKAIRLRIFHVTKIDHPSPRVEQCRSYYFYYTKIISNQRVLSHDTTPLHRKFVRLKHHLAN